MTMVSDIVIDGFFAAIAGIGFGAIARPPRRAFKYIALLAALGHALRYSLMTYFGFDISTASLCASSLIGFGSLWLGKKCYCPITVLYIPALLPMIPGKIAYNAIFSLLMFLQTMDEPVERAKYLELFFTNGLVSSTAIFMLAVGATLPIFLFPKHASSLTRRKLYKD